MAITELVGVAIQKTVIRVSSVIAYVLHVYYSSLMFGLKWCDCEYEINEHF